MRQVSRQYPQRRLLYLKPFLFIFPIVFFATAFTYYPFVKTLAMSFSKVSSIGEIRSYVGFYNYEKLFGREAFINALLTTFRYTLMYLPLSIILPLLLALLARQKRRGSGMYQTMFSLPMVMSTVAWCTVFSEMYRVKNGFINYFLTQLGVYNNLTLINWLNDKTWALPALTLIQLWHIGFSFMLLLAALRNVPEEQLESVTLDGAGYWASIWHIMLPSVSPTLFFLLCTNMISALMMNGPVLILTSGGPQNTTTTLIYYIYNAGFSNSNYAMGSTASVVAFAITLAFTLLNFLYEKKGVVYQ